MAATRKLFLIACSIFLASSSQEFSDCKKGQHLSGQKLTFLNGTKTNIDQYAGHVTLVVNVASFWGLTTPSYNFLNALQQKYGGTDNCSLKVLAFPSNQVIW